MSMDSYRSVLADLKTKRDKLNATIAALEEQMGVTKEEPQRLSRESTQSPTEPSVATSNEYSKMTMKGASVSHLKKVGAAQTTRQLTDAITAGGLRSESASLYRTLYNVLNVDSERENGLIVKIGSSWGLREWPSN
jgi:hypothetical protein